MTVAIQQSFIRDQVRLRKSSWTWNLHQRLYCFRLKSYSFLQSKPLCKRTTTSTELQQSSNKMLSCTTTKGWAGLRVNYKAKYIVFVWVPNGAASTPISVLPTP